MLRFCSMSCCFAALLGFATVVHADTVTVSNGDFSAPAFDPTPGNENPFGTPYDWSSTDTNGWVGNTYTLSLAPDNPCAWYAMRYSAEGQSLYQNLTTDYKPNHTYTLSYDYCVPTGVPNNASLKSSLLYDSNSKFFVASATESVVAGSGWKHGSISATTGSDITGPITVAFWLNSLNTDTTKETFTQVYFDNVTITAVPEPATLALVATTIASLLAYAWRKRK